MDLLQYNFQKYNVDSFRQGYLSITPIGAVVFVIFLLVSYLVEIYDTHNAEIEKEYLIKMAYYDYLTQTGNRTKCNLLMEELNNENISYGIISMDLNDLKKANDSKGHNFGDVLICGLAEVLKRSFEPMGMVGRMGGDEFIVILKSVSKEKIEELIKTFKWNLEIENDKNPEFQLRVSYGYAMDNEVEEKDAGKVYNLADARMYQMKEIYHRIQDCKDKNIEL
jgi:diguanylate cyclase (GGDEF)-like protein